MPPQTSVANNIRGFVGQEQQQQQQQHPRGTASVREAVRAATTTTTRPRGTPKNWSRETEKAPHNRGLAGVSGGGNPDSVHHGLPPPHEMNRNTVHCVE
mmetsp:Transcript_9515/g.19977  ORF Transcript_9515/g.19977 Transcript_9515/m.19977 type:complete len:99 (+) Transcript_9515:495-791(+)